MDVRLLRSEFRLNPSLHTTMNFVRRLAVSGMVFLLGLAANSGVFAAQCGGLPKGWKPAETQASSTPVDVMNFAGAERPASPAPAPCQCRGASCHPAAPAPAPERGVVLSVSIDAMLDRSMCREPVRISPEFPATVNSMLRYEVVLGVFRPPCGV